ncbi:MAG: caspase family protein [Pirellulaceae bacterium]|nr:caspase family protein [Planctomycetales bacterium]
MTPPTSQLAGCNPFDTTRPAVAPAGRRRLLSACTISVATMLATLLATLPFHSVINRAAAEEGDADKKGRAELIVRRGVENESFVDIDISPDGQCVLALFSTGVIRVYEAETGLEIASSKADGAVIARFSPNSQNVILLKPGDFSTMQAWQWSFGGDQQEIELLENALGLQPTTTIEGRCIGGWVGDDQYQTIDADTGETVGKFTMLPNTLADKKDYLQTSEGHASILPLQNGYLVATSGDGRYVGFETKQHEIAIYKTGADRPVRVIELFGGPSSLRLSRTGKYLAYANLQGIVVTETENDKVVLNEESLAGGLSFSANEELFYFSIAPDNSIIYPETQEVVGRLLTLPEGQPVDTITAENATAELGITRFSADNASLLTAATGDVWDFRSFSSKYLFGKRPVSELARLEQTYVGETTLASGIGFSPDGKQLVVCRSDNSTRLWEVSTGGQREAFRGHKGIPSGVQYSQDGKYLVTGSFDGFVRLWDVATRRELRQYETDPLGKPEDKLGYDAPTRVRISPDKKLVAACSIDGNTYVWATDTGERLAKLRHESLAMEFSQDSKHLLIDNVLLDTQRFEIVREYKGAQGRFTRMHGGSVFINGGRQVLVCQVVPSTLFRKASSNLVLYNLEEDTVVKEIPIEDDELGFITTIRLSPNEKQICLVGTDAVMACDALSGEKQFTVEVAQGITTAYSPDGKWLLISSLTDGIHVVDAATGKVRCQLYGFRDGDWAVIDDAGRYDASNGGSVRGLYWRVQGRTVALEQLKERYYDPGLLAKIMGTAEEPLRAVEALRTPRLFPNIEVRADEDHPDKFSITLEDQGGGIGPLVVKLNGKEVAIPQQPNALPRGRDGDYHVAIDLSDDARLMPGQQNILEVYAYNEEGYLRSRGVRRVIVPTARTETAPPRLWGIVIGISDYAGTDIDLQFAAKDADAFATSLEVAAHRLFGPERVTIQRWIGSDGALDVVTREHIHKAIQIVVQQSQPQDVVVIYLAGHGVVHGGDAGDFYYLLQQARTADLSDPEVRRTTAMSSSEFVEQLRETPAQKQVMILDTCAAGRFVEQLTKPRSVPSNQIRAMERMKDRTGLYILAGCAADRQSYEATRFGQGLLTYSLLMGMRGAALRENKFVDVSRLFEFAADEVPDLANHIGGVQRPLIAMPSAGASFDMGALTSEDKARIPLQSIRPIMARSSFQDERRLRDHLQLASLVNERLRVGTPRGNGRDLVFIDAIDVPDAYEMYGRYRVTDGKVTVRVLIVQGEQDIAEFELAGATSDVPSLADAICETAHGKVIERANSP